MSFGALSVAALAVAWAGSWMWRANPSYRARHLAGVSLLFLCAIDWTSALWLLAMTGLVHVLARRNLTGARNRTAIAGIATIAGSMVVLRFTPDILDGTGLSTIEWLQVTSWWQPIGIAVISLQAIGYLIDVRRGDADPVAWSHEVLLLAFFPRLFAGPLVRTRRFSAMLESPWDGNVPVGHVAMRLTSAVFKRYVLVETLTRFEARTTVVNAELGFIDGVANLASGPLRFLLDMSALTDLAIAIGLCCGITLPENFNRPYRALSVAAAFRGWHMTVSGWFRDYVMLPATGLRPSNARLSASTIATFVLIALWHHLTVTAVAWGLAFGSMVSRDMLRARARRETDPPSRVRRIGRRVGVFAFFALTGPLFDGSTLASAARSWQPLLNTPFATSFLDPITFAVLVVGYAVGFGAFSGLYTRAVALADRIPGVVVGVAVGVYVTVIVGVAGDVVPSFIYQRL